MRHCFNDFIRLVEADPADSWHVKLTQNQCWLKILKYWFNWYNKLPQLISGTNSRSLLSVHGYTVHSYTVHWIRKRANLRSTFPCEVGPQAANGSTDSTLIQPFQPSFRTSFKTSLKTSFPFFLSWFWSEVISGDHSCWVFRLRKNHQKFVLRSIDQPRLPVSSCSN